MNVHLYDTPAAIAQLEPEWNALAAGNPLHSYEWLAGWFEIYGADSRLFVLGIRDESGRLVGLAPWHISESFQRGVEIRPVGDGEVCTDHLTIFTQPGLTQPGCEQQIAHQIAEFLDQEHQQWDLLRLDDIDADNNIISQLAEALVARDCRLQLRDAIGSWQIELPGNWDEFLAMQSKSHRKQLRRSERSAEASGAYQWHLASTPAEFETAWPIFIDLHQRRRKSLGEPGCFASERFAEFHTTLAKKLLAKDQLRLSYLSINGKPAAAEHHFAGADAIYAYQGGLDPDLIDQDSGRLSMIATIKHAISEGRTTFDLMRGNEPYKAHWRAVHRPAHHYRIVPPRATARLRAGATSVVGALRNGAKLLKQN